MIAAQLASRGPAVAAYIECYQITHTTRPDSVDIARALAWPGDHLDHDRALEALASVEWITPVDTRRDIRVGRRWIERNQPTRTAVSPHLRDDTGRTNRWT